MGKQYHLRKGIISLSESEEWSWAKSEWKVDYVYWVDDPKTCLCGHYPIKEICVIRNKHNQATTEVGNVCVEKFMGLSSDKLFKSLRKIMKDNTKAVNSDVILYSFAKEWINDWERKFYLDTWRKRKLTDKMLKKRVQINDKILFQTKRSNQLEYS